MAYSPWGRKEWDATEHLSTHSTLYVKVCSFECGMNSGRSNERGRKRRKSRNIESAWREKISGKK